VAQSGYAKTLGEGVVGYSGDWRCERGHRSSIDKSAPMAPNRARFSCQAAPTQAASWMSVRLMWLGQPAHQFDLDAHGPVGGGAVAIEFMAERSEGGHEVPVGGDVLCGRGALVLRHALLFLAEVRGGLGTELVEQPGNLGRAAAHTHGGEQVVEPRDELTMLVVHAVDARRHRSVPGDGRHFGSMVWVLRRRTAAGPVELSMQVSGVETARLSRLA
jgi:hypothetical protein